jgi:hypothetical protein
MQERVRCMVETRLLASHRIEVRGLTVVSPIGELGTSLILS